MELILPARRKLEKESRWLEYDKGFNHALMLCVDMAKDQGFIVKVGAKQEQKEE